MRSRRDVIGSVWRGGEKVKGRQGLREERRALGSRPRDEGLERRESKRRPEMTNVQSGEVEG
jgi:hypothetical protein